MIAPLTPIQKRLDTLPGGAWTRSTARELIRSFPGHVKVEVEYRVVGSTGSQ